MISRFKHRSIWALADQGIVSLGNFGANLLLARSLPAVEYGIFSLIYGLMLLLYAVQTSVVLYPLSVLSARATVEQRYAVSGAGFAFTAWVVAPCCLILAGGGFLLNAKMAGFAAVFAFASWQLQETARRLLLSYWKTTLMVAGDVVSYLGQLALLLLLIVFHRIQLPIAFIALGLTSLAGWLIQAHAAHFAVSFAEARRHWLTFWKLGKFCLQSNLLNAAAVLLCPWVLATRSVVYSAEFNALGTALGVTNLFALGLGNFLTPFVAVQAHRNGIESAKTFAFTIIKTGSMLLFGYFAAMVFWPRACLTLIFGSASPYIHLATDLRWLAAGYCASYLSHVLSSILYGLTLGDRVLRGQIGAMAVALIAALPLTYLFGLRGASIGFALMQIVRLTIVWILLKRGYDNGALPAPIIEGVPNETII